MLLETRIWQALHVLAILVTAFVTLYGAFYVPSAFTEKRLQRSLFFAGDVTSALSALGDRIKLSILIDNTPVNNLVLLIGSISNTGSVAIIPSDFYENLSINVDKEWKILLAKNSTGKEHPVWKKVNDQKFEASPELLNPGDSITVNVYATNTQHLTQDQTLHQLQILQELNPIWSAHILNLKSITESTNPITEITRDPFSTVAPIVLLYGSALVVASVGAIFFMTIYINLLYSIDFIRNSRWQSVGAIVGVGIISVTSSEAMTTYLFPNILNRLTGVDNWSNMPCIVLNLAVLVWLSFKAWKAHAVPPLPHS